VLRTDAPSSELSSSDGPDSELSSSKWSIGELERTKKKLLFCVSEQPRHLGLLLRHGLYAIDFPRGSTHSCPSMSFVCLTVESYRSVPVRSTVLRCRAATTVHTTHSPPVPRSGTQPSLAFSRGVLWFPPPVPPFWSARLSHVTEIPSFLGS
jgi:hypothetical protein